MKRTPNCSFSTRDGSPCGRKVTDGSQPPVCHIHAGKTNSPLIPSPDETDPLRIVRRLTRSTDDRVKLRAVELLLELERRAKTDTTKAGQNVDAFLAVLTDDERETLRSLHHQLQAVRQHVYERHPDLRPPQEFRYAAVQQREEQAGPEPDLRPAPREHATRSAAASRVEVGGVIFEDGIEE